MVYILLLVMTILLPFRLQENRPVDFLASLIIGSWDVVADFEVFFGSLEEGAAASPVVVSRSSLLAILRRRTPAFIAEVADVALIIDNDNDSFSSSTVVDDLVGSIGFVDDGVCASNLPTDLWWFDDGGSAAFWSFTDDLVVVEDDFSTTSCCCCCFLLVDDFVSRSLWLVMVVDVGVLDVVSTIDEFSSPDTTEVGTASGFSAPWLVFSVLSRLLVFIILLSLAVLWAASISTFSFSPSFSSSTFVGDSSSSSGF